MESLELRIFEEVAKTQSISRAAENLMYVQSNVSKHIQNLEEELNCKLFIRSNKGVTLTEEGETLLGFAHNVVSLLDNAKNSAMFMEKKILKIGATQTIAAFKLPHWLAAFKKIIPEAQFSVSIFNQKELVNQVENGQLDCAFVNTDFQSPQVFPISSFSDPMNLVIPPELALSEIKNQEIVVSSFKECPYRKALNNWMIKHFQKQPHLIEIDSLEGMIESVRLGLGISLLPQSVSNLYQTCKIADYDDFDSVRIHFIVPKTRRNKTVEKFSNVITE